MEHHACPAWLISAPSSGTGKTTLVAALAKYHRQQGREVRVFKTGPDFLDPKILERASGHPVHQLDLWMVGEQQCKQLLYEAAGEADLILVEGVMGLFDGKPSSADLAKQFGLPVLAIINAGAMAQTFGAIAHGLASYDKDLSLSAVVANGVASPGHNQMLEESVASHITYLGGIAKKEEIALPDRHLGLVQADEIADLESRLQQAAALIEQSGLTILPEPVMFKAEDLREQEKLLSGIRIGIARDQAFSFIYPANIDVLRNMGATLEFFSPLSDTSLPRVDSLYFPGGYPELFAEQLSNNKPMKQAIREHHQLRKTILAECGGMMYLIEELVTTDGTAHPMVGLIPGKISMQKRLATIGLQAAEFADQELRGHTFHYSTLETTLENTNLATRHYDGKQGEAIYQHNGLTASYIHWYFPSNPSLSASLLGKTPAH
jgi:cobyrinic acid a,c-diamide synthase